MTHNTIKAIAATLLTATLPMALHAENKTEQNSPSEPKRHEYHFDRIKITPKGMAIFGPAMYVFDNKTLTTLVGTPLEYEGKAILDVDVSPIGNEYIVVGADKKNNEAALMGISYGNRKLFKLKRKEFGNPFASAYTPDLKHILIATDRGLMSFDRRTHELVDSMRLPYSAVDQLVLSPNNYYLAVGLGPKVTVYNFETKKPRQSWDFEVKVNDMTFNDDNTEFAVITEDGILNIYDTRSFLIKKTLDDVGEGLSCSYTSDGKYMTVATSPTHIQIINLLDPSDRENIEVPSGAVSVVRFISDLDGQPLMAYTTTGALDVRRMSHLAPYYGRLVQEEANQRLNEWLKMMPGETMEQYQARVNDETRANQLRLYEEEAATRMAPDMLSMATVGLGSYDRGNGVLQVDFDNMPSIFLPVPESDLGAFSSAGDLQFRNAKYGVMADDKFELIYAEVLNSANGKSYTFNNINRVPLNFMSDADNVVSITLIQQQQMEEMRLQEVREEVMAKAKSENVISDHTHIAVNSQIIPDYDADGNKILNYNVKFAYEVEPDFTAVEDFAPGKYRAEQSGAASSMLKLVSQAMDGELAQYLKQGKKLKVKISGTADATPIVSRIIYDGCYGEIVDEPVYDKEKISSVTIRPNDQITENQQLAFLRAYGVHNYLVNNIARLSDMQTDYRYDINVTEGKGSEFRRITVDFTFVDAF